MTYSAPSVPAAGLRLHFNENTGGCSPAVLAALRSIARTDTAFYPDYAAVTSAAERYFGVPAGWVQLTNGLDEGLHVVAPLEPGAGWDVVKRFAIAVAKSIARDDPERFTLNLSKARRRGRKEMEGFVLAQNQSPKAQALVEQIARGGANPDLQLKAISYMDMRRKPANAQVLAEIYASTNDNAVKRAILQAYAGARDKDHLMQLIKNEKSLELREVALGTLGGNPGTPELWQLYQTETTPEGKIQLLRYMYNNSSSEKLMDVVKKETDPKVRAEAVRVLASQKTGLDGTALVAIYNAEQDSHIKNSILDSLMGQRNAKAMIEIIRQEKDQKIKLRIVERLSNMKNSKEAQDYLEELLKK